jgi:hypothetical protein
VSGPNGLKGLRANLLELRPDRERHAPRVDRTLLPRQTGGRFGAEALGEW